MNRRQGGYGCCTAFTWLMVTAVRVYFAVTLMRGGVGFCAIFFPTYVVALVLAYGVRASNFFAIKIGRNGEL